MLANQGDLEGAQKAWEAADELGDGQGAARVGFLLINPVGASGSSKGLTMPGAIRREPSAATP